MHLVQYKQIIFYINLLLILYLHFRKHLFEGTINCAAYNSSYLLFVFVKPFFVLCFHNYRQFKNIYLNIKTTSQPW